MMKSWQFHVNSSEEQPQHEQKHRTSNASKQLVGVRLPYFSFVHKVHL